MMHAESNDTKPKITPVSPRSAGSIYLVTLITIAAVSSMVLVGVKLRSATTSNSALVADMTQNLNSSNSAIEFALEHIAQNDKWGTQAQTGIPFENFTIDGTTYSGTVTDLSTSARPTPTTTQFRITLSGESANAQSKAQFDLNCTKIDYIALIESLSAWNYWPLNETTGATRAIDALASDDGQYLDNSVPAATTNDEGAYVPLFNDTNDHIEVPWVNQFKGNWGSFSMWIKSTEEAAYTTYGIMGSRFAEGGNPGLMLTIFSGGLYAFITDNGSYDFRLVASSSSKLIQVDQWHHVAVTWGAAGLTIYLDGNRVARNESNTSGFDTDKKKDGGECPIVIGSSFINVLGSVTQVGFKGSIAHVVHHWNHQLTDDEVAELAKVKPDLNEFNIIDDSWAIVYE